MQHQRGQVLPLAPISELFLVKFSGFFLKFIEAKSARYFRHSARTGAKGIKVSPHSDAKRYPPTGLSLAPRPIIRAIFR